MPGPMQNNRMGDLGQAVAANGSQASTVVPGQLGGRAQAFQGAIGEIKAASPGGVQDMVDQTQRGID